MKYTLGWALLFLASLTNAQSIIGTWKTIDDDSGKPRSIVEISEKDGLFYGKIKKLFREPYEDPDPVCNRCEDYRKGQKIIGMEILSDMKLDEEDKEYTGGGGNNGSGKWKHL